MSQSDSAEPRSDAAPQATPLITLTTPREGTPPTITTERELAAAAHAISSGDGPVAIDAERASGIRYANRAYLVQVRREGSGTWLIDPIALPDLRPLAEAIGGAEWILHAATQDLACLADVGLRPHQLFDTELAGRLLGLDRVGLASVVEHYLGITLAKEHSAVDWSTRPLPHEWLSYAALDVEVLIDIRNLMGVDLAAHDKAEWARQEFEALLTWQPPVRVDPWRRTSGLSSLKGQRQLAVLRELWQTRDRLARERDLAPGRLLPDAVLVELARVAPRELSQLPPGHRALRRHGEHWVDAVRRAGALQDADLPPRTLRSGEPPPVRAWADKAPLAASRLAHSRAALAEFSRHRTIPVENICTPSFLRKVLWAPPRARDEAAFTRALLELGARPWQTEVVAPMLVAAFAEHPD